MGLNSSFAVMAASFVHSNEDNNGWQLLAYFLHLPFSVVYFYNCLFQRRKGDHEVDRELRYNDI